MRQKNNEAQYLHQSTYLFPEQHFFPPWANCLQTYIIFYCCTSVLVGRWLMQGSSASGLPAVIHPTLYLRSGLAICEPCFVQSLMVLLFDKNWHNLAYDDHEVPSPFCLHGDCLNWEILHISLLHFSK